ncbi:MAG: hypothetical protein QNJ15_11815, partial [Erythrobacter sp.]|nr:hypothetical protein [Erythrobacter sp.]
GINHGREPSTSRACIFLRVSSKSKGRFFDMGEHISTAWGHWGKIPIDPGLAQIRAAKFGVFSTGEFRQGPGIPAFHRANRLHQTFYKYLIFD